MAREVRTGAGQIRPVHAILCQHAPDQELGRELLCQCQLEAGVSMRERREQSRNQVRRKRRNRAHAQPADERIAVCAPKLYEGIRFLERPAGVLHQRLTERRERDRLVCPLEQRCPELLLELADLP